MPTDPDITAVLQAWSDGDEQALNDLMQLVYTDLWQLSRRAMAGERKGHTLQPTALVNEVYMRLARLKEMRWENRRAFFGFAVRLMRQVLVEHARALRTKKRKTKLQRVDVELAELPGEEQGLDLLELDDLLRALDGQDPGLVKLIELRFFSNLTERETAEVLGVSRSTVQRQWALAKRLLIRTLGKDIDGT